MEITRTEAFRATEPMRANTAAAEPKQAEKAPVDSVEVSAAGNGKKTVTFEFDGRKSPEVKNVGLKGSFDPVKGTYDPNWNGG